MTFGDQRRQQEPDGTWPRRPLDDAERALLHRVLGMIPDGQEPDAARLREAIGNGSRQQDRDLTDDENEELGGVLLKLLTDWESPRIFRDPSPMWNLAGADVARLGLIWRGIMPFPADPGILRVNAADWGPEPGIPDDWVIATAPRPIRAPVSARSWRGENGEFYAAWPLEDDDDDLWTGSDIREVVRYSNYEIAEHAGRYLAATGLLPGEAGLTATEVIRGLPFPWKDGLLDEEQVREAATAWTLDDQREDENLAYDGWSSAPPRRELTSSERAFLQRVVAQAAADPRWAQEEVTRRPAIRLVLGDGTRPQVRDLTARERDDIGGMIRLIDGERRSRLGEHVLSPWVHELTSGEIARLALINKAITPRHGDQYMDGPVLINAADWAPPQPVPDGWVIGNAPVPLAGPVAWQGPPTAHGEFYAAAPDDDEDPYGGWLEECGDTHRVEIITDEDAVDAVSDFLGSHGCRAPEDAGMTIAEVARDLGYPLPADRADEAIAAASRVWVLETRHKSTDTTWYAVHGTRARDHVIRAAGQAGFPAVPVSEIPLDGAATGAAEMIRLILRQGWEAVYVRGPASERVTAVNPEGDAQVGQSWDMQGRPSGSPGNLDLIMNWPRPLRLSAGPRTNTDEADSAAGQSDVPGITWRRRREDGQTWYEARAEDKVIARAWRHDSTPYGYYDAFRYRLLFGTCKAAMGTDKLASAKREVGAAWRREHEPEAGSGTQADCATRGEPADGEAVTEHGSVPKSARRALGAVKALRPPAWGGAARGMNRRKPRG